MIRTFGLKSSYSPIVKVGDGVYKVCWDYIEIKDPVYAELTEEQKEQEAAGEIIERTKIDEIDTEYCTYMCEYIYGNITITDIKKLITDWYNNETKYQILTGFVWNNNSVWLSEENQHDFSEALRTANSDSSILPVTMKIGEKEDMTPIYTVFETVEELDEFCNSVFIYINNTLKDGWKKKDSIDWSLYQIPA